MANTYAKAYIDIRRSQALDDLGAAGAQVQGKIGDLEKQIDAIPVVGNPPHAADPALESRREALINQQSVYRQRLDQLQLEAGLNSGGAQLVTPASVPRSPVSPRRAPRSSASCTRREASAREIRSRSANAGASLPPNSQGLAWAASWLIRACSMAGC